LQHHRIIPTEVSSLNCSYKDEHVAVTSNDVSAAEITRRTAILSTCSILALFPSSSHAAAASVSAGSKFGEKKRPPLTDQVRAIENANYIGQITKKIYQPNISGDPEQHLPRVTIDSQNNLVMTAPHQMVTDDYIQFMWLKDVESGDIVVVKAFPPTEPSPPTLKVRVPSGVTLRPALFCSNNGLWIGENFIVK